MWQTKPPGQVPLSHALRVVVAATQACVSGAIGSGAQLAAVHESLLQTLCEHTNGSTQSEVASQGCCSERGSGSLESCWAGAAGARQRPLEHVYRSRELRAIRRAATKNVADSLRLAQRVARAHAEHRFPARHSRHPNATGVGVVALGRAYATDAARQPALLARVASVQEVGFAVGAKPLLARTRCR